MKKFRTQQIFRNALLFVGIFSFLAFNACKKDDPDVVDPIATFQFEISETNFLEVIFTNYSQNATTYLWNFGDGQTSTEKDPSHVYEAPGTFTVQLTASNADGVSATFSQTIEVKDPDVALGKLAGETSKTWRLHRVGTSMGVGPDAAGARTWWSLGNTGVRPCLYYQEFTFNRAGEFIFDDNGSFWGEEAVFGAPLAGTCFEATAANMVNKNGVNVSDWLSGTHQFAYEPALNRVTLTGNGAWMGMPQLGTSGESLVPEPTRSFKAIIEEFDGYDLLTISYAYADLYWDFTYASYSNPALEPDVVSFFVDFSFTIDDMTVTFKNLSKDAVSYSWAFGDGNTSTQENPVHTYAADGIYAVVLTATSTTGDTKTATRDVVISSAAPTDLPPAPTEPEANVISIFSDAYTPITGVNLNPGWGQATVTSVIEIAGEEVLKMAGLNYQGIDWAGNAQDVSGKTKLHVDIWCAEVTTINISLIGTGGENPVAITTEAGVWKSIDILLSDYTVPNLSSVIQLKFDDAGSETFPTIFVDNIYFY